MRFLFQKIQKKTSPLLKLKEHHALAERLNGTIKNDFFPKKVYQNHKEACIAVSKIIQIYNQKRPHASIDYLTPDQAQTKEGYIKKRWKNYSKHLKQKEGNMQVEE